MVNAKGQPQDWTWPMGDQKGAFLGMIALCPACPAHVLFCPLLPRVKQSELFDRWKSLQMCKWAMNISEANQFKYL